MNAAKIVSECGSKFNRVAKDLAGHVSDEWDDFPTERYTRLPSVSNLKRDAI